MYTDNINLLAKNEKEFKTNTNNKNIQLGYIEFGIEKCAMLIMRSGRRQIMQRIELPYKEKTRTRERKETCKYLVS